MTQLCLVLCFHGVHMTTCPSCARADPNCSHVWTYVYQIYTYNIFTIVVKNNFRLFWQWYACRNPSPFSVLLLKTTCLFCQNPKSFLDLSSKSLLAHRLGTIRDFKADLNPLLVLPPPQTILKYQNLPQIMLNSLVMETISLYYALYMLSLIC